MLHSFTLRQQLQTARSDLIKLFIRCLSSEPTMVSSLCFDISIVSVIGIGTGNYSVAEPEPQRDAAPAATAPAPAATAPAPAQNPIEKM
jgi:hypothetical protein